MVTVFHYTPVNAKQFDGLNIDGLAGKCQKRQNFPRQNFAPYGIKLHLSSNSNSPEAGCIGKHMCSYYTVAK